MSVEIPVIERMYKRTNSSCHFIFPLITLWESLQNVISVKQASANGSDRNPDVINVHIC